MSPNKRRTIEINNPNENESINHWRSSLKVNLSYASNLSESNDALRKQTPVEHYDKTTLNAVEMNASSRVQISIHSKQCESDYNRPVQNTNTVLEKISNAEHSLNRNCEKLKHAVLHKTKQLFDQENELFIKTCTILNDKDMQLKTQTVNNTFASTAKKKITLGRSKTTDNAEKYKCKSDNFKDQRRVKEKQLSDTLNNVSSTPCKIHFTNEMQDSGTNCSLSCPNQPASFISHTSTDNDIFTDVPIGCSTMIQKAVGKQDEVLCHNTNNLLFPSDECTKTYSISMEVTDNIHGMIILNGSQIKHNKDTTFVSNSANVISKSKNKEITCPTIKIGLTSIKGTNASLKMQSVLQLDSESVNGSMALAAEDSVNTVGSSMNVNTSADALDESNKSNDKKVPKYCEIKNSITYPKHRDGNDLYTTVAEKLEDNADTLCTSLQMNTSLDTSNSLNLRRNHDRNEISTLENTVNISTRKKKCSPSMNNASRTSDTAGEGRIDDAHATNQNERIINRLEESWLSFIEATPYPTSRSVLFKSQWKQNGIIRSDIKNDNRIDSAEPPSSEANIGKTEEKCLIDTTILNDSSSYDVSHTKKRVSVVMKDSTNEIKLRKNEYTKDLIAPVTKIKCKKKLLPLHECSQLSLSPVEEECLPSERMKRYRGRKIKRVTKKLNVMYTANNMEQNDEMEATKQSSTENDCTLCYSEIRKQKKPKKVVSKKIVVSKIVEEDILMRLEQERNNVEDMQEGASIPSRSSLNDFQSLKALCSTQLAGRTEKRIRIVTTGLSNEDKGVVKRVVKTLGQAKIDSIVTKYTTHVVATGVRTINLLHGIIRGCWLVGLEWVFKSLENNVWLDPEEYEMSHFSKAVLENRKDRQLFGSSYVPELFAACGYMYVGKNTKTPGHILKDLVKAAGGRITENPEIAKVVIGSEGLKESWVLDCITTGDLQPYNQYQYY